MVVALVVIMAETTWLDAVTRDSRRQSSPNAAMPLKSKVDFMPLPNPLIFEGEDEDNMVYNVASNDTFPWTFCMTAYHLLELVTQPGECSGYQCTCEAQRGPPRTFGPPI